MLSINLEQYSQIGAWIKGLASKKALNVTIEKPTKNFISMKDEFISFSYIIVDKYNEDNRTYLYIEEHGIINSLNLRLKKFNNDEINLKFVDLIIIEAVLIDMYIAINSNVDFTIEVDEFPLIPYSSNLMDLDFNIEEPF